MQIGASFAALSLTCFARLTVIRRDSKTGTGSSYCVVCVWDLQVPVPNNASVVLVILRRPCSA